MAHIIVEELGYWELYAPLLGTLHPNIWTEAKNMAKSKGRSKELDLSPLVEEVGLEKYLAVVKVGDYISAFGAKKVLKEIGVKGILANLSSEDRQKLKEQLLSKTSS